MININLSPNKKVLKFGGYKIDTKSIPWGKWAALILIGYIPGYYLDNHHYPAKLEVLEKNRDRIAAERTDIQKKIARYKEGAAQFEKHQKDQKLLEEQLSRLQILTSQRKNPFPYLKEMTSLVSKDMWMTGMQLEKDTLTLSGKTLTFNRITDFLKRINESVFYRGATLEQHREEESGLQTFSLKITIAKLEDGF